ncbi:pseudouridine synthase [Spirochaeta cellobiosiphila]|uniref:pseudouridine synthase n=1 Tax=Spirochaeta cellobiosiphila TaxID=504483 RepID=UPI00041C8750|nr:pseudouridine synthase [Spirochaeta cellobiosiphila]
MSSIPNESNDEVRLQVYLSHAGIASRRGAIDIIESGRITVNGRTIKKPGHRVSLDDEIRFDGRPINVKKKFIYLLLHKPTKYLCSNADPSGRPLAIDLIKPVISERLYNVGRLDYLTSGLLIFTNDGSFNEKMIHPRYNVEKEYTVVTKKEIPVELMEQFKSGILIDGTRYKAKDYELRGSRQVNLILEEGKNREIRNVFLSKNIFVKRVHRVRLGNLQLKGLSPGQFRFLKQTEVQNLLDIAEGKRKNPKFIKKQRRSSD